MMQQKIADITGFGVVLCLISYGLGVWLKGKLRYAIFNPLLIAVILVITLLSLTGIEYKVFRDNSEQ